MNRLVSAIRTGFSALAVSSCIIREWTPVYPFSPGSAFADGAETHE